MACLQISAQVEVGRAAECSTTKENISGFDWTNTDIALHAAEYRAATLLGLRITKRTMAISWLKQKWSSSPSPDLKKV